MAVNFEEGLANLEKLISFVDEEVPLDKRNEATTRLHLIDGLLFDCLGWDRKDCRAEDRFGGTYTDYSFLYPECLLIVEAKKEGTCFELPAGDTKLKYNIQYFEKHASSVYLAITQALEYCQTRGTPYGMISNGHQVIAFIGSRIDGHPPCSGNSLVFNSLAALKDNFLLVWQCLSRQGVLTRRLSLELQDVSIAPVPEKMAARIVGYPGFKSRNSLQTDLNILSDLIIEDIARVAGKDEEPEFLKQCYCTSGALSQYALVSKEILRNRYNAMFTKAADGPSTKPVTTKKGLDPELVAQSLSRRPILLIGDVGVGKTIFLKHFCEVEAKDVFEDAIIINVNFGSKPALEEDVQFFVGNEIQNQLRENYGIDLQENNFISAIFHGELLGFEKGLYAPLKMSAPEMFQMHKINFLEEKLRDKDEFMRKSLLHITKGRKKQIVVFLDNVDQRPDRFQEQAFLIGQSIAENWPAMVFISIRPETFFRSRSAGTLKAYHPRAFTISPPNVKEVIYKRLKYGVDLLRRGVPLGPDAQISLRASSLADYLNVLACSFDENKYLLEFLVNMCGGNIRLALDFVRIFIGSGHVNTEKILSIYKETGRYLVPLHEFIRAITFVDYEYYSPQASVILNLFDISMLDGKEHFLSSILLAQMTRWGQQSTTDGFVHVSEVYSYLQALGFHPYQIERTLERLLYRNLLETVAKKKPENDPVHSVAAESSFYRITTIGAYYVRRLITQFAYLDAVIVDTPIINSDARSEISEVSSIQDRLDRARQFIEYLDSQWNLLPDCDLPFNWPTTRKQIDRDIDYVAGKVAIREDIIDEAKSTN